MHVCSPGLSPTLAHHRKVIYKVYIIQPFQHDNLIFPLHVINVVCRCILLMYILQIFLYSILNIENNIDIVRGVCLTVGCESKDSNAQRRGVGNHCLLQPVMDPTRVVVLTNNEIGHLWEAFIPPCIYPCSEEWNKGFVGIQFNLFMLKCCDGKQLTELMVLVTPVSLVTNWDNQDIPLLLTF